jgi:hypothetical protein
MPKKHSRLWTYPGGQRGRGRSKSRWIDRVEEDTRKLLFLKFESPCIIIRFKYINQQDETFSQVYFLTFMCGSTCFGRLSAHHEERRTALEAPGFTVGAWRLEGFWSWSADYDQQRSKRHAPMVKPRAPSAVVRS